MILKEFAVDAEAVVVIEMDGVGVAIRDDPTLRWVRRSGGRGLRGVGVGGLRLVELWELGGARL